MEYTDIPYIVLLSILFFAVGFILTNNKNNNTRV